jgi:thiol-disulfide isomerase/thioredoxin
MKNIILLLILLLTANLLMAEIMPDFTLPDLNDRDVALQEILHNGPVIVDFWATWCVPCKKAMKALNKLADKYDSLTVVSVSIDAPKDIPKAKTYLKSMNYKFINLFDSNQKLAQKLNVVNPPYTVILDKNGNIIYTHEGYEAGVETAYEQKILELLIIEDVKPETAEPEQDKAEQPDPEKSSEPVADAPNGGCQ